MVTFPGLVGEISLHGIVKVIISLLQIEHGDVIIRYLARHHPAADLGFAGLFLFTLDWPWGEAHTASIVMAGYHDRSSACEEVVAADVVGAPESIGRDAIAEGEGSYGVVVVV
jgi:hypothetical protein